MSRLLVSVRSSEEASAALTGGAHLIDIKEPTRGPLGAAEVDTWRAVLAVVAGQAPVSAALGELLDAGCLPLAPAAMGLSLVKAGLAGCAHEPSWPARLRELQRSLPETVHLAAVSYADAALASAPSPYEILHVARELKITTLLIDTYDKLQGDLFRQRSLSELSSIIDAARAANIQVALAGSLTLETIPVALRLSPEWIAVRGAACQQGHREAGIDAQRVAILAQQLQQMPQST